MSLTVGAIGLSALSAKAEVVSITSDAKVNVAGIINLGKGTLLMGNPYSCKVWAYGANSGAISETTAYFSVGAGAGNYTNIQKRTSLAKENGNYERDGRTYKSQANVKIEYNKQTKIATSYAD